MKYHNITKDDMLNGKGLRVCLWLSGCVHNCSGCHNPSTHNIDSGVEFDLEAKEELFLELKKDYINGVTFTGGDPLHPKNRDELTELIKEVKEFFPNKTIWLYTGYTIEQINNLELLNYIDVLCDSKYDEEKVNRNIKWVGSSNQRVIDVQKTLKENKLILLED